MHTAHRDARGALPSALLAALVCLTFARSSLAEIRRIGAASIPANARDLSRLGGTVGPGRTPQDSAGSFGSAIEYSGAHNLYYMLNDRGPNDGDADFLCRFQEVVIDIGPTASDPVVVRLAKTVLLRTDQGTSYTGAASAFHPSEDRAARRLDPEGIRIGPRGTLYISDEYGPWIDQFSLDGSHLKRFEVPKRFRIDHPASRKSDELPPHNHSGRVSNKGFEGLAVSPDGARLYALLQSPLLQDAALDRSNKAFGINVRLLELHVATGATREYVYPLDAPDLGCNELLAVDDARFLVIERDGKEGTAAKVKHIQLIDLAGATDVGRVESLPSRALPPMIKPVRKRLLIDLLDRKFTLNGESMPEKVEGLAFGPRLADGARSLIVSIDNDFRTDKPTTVWVFSVPESDLSRVDR